MKSDFLWKKIHIQDEPFSVMQLSVKSGSLVETGFAVTSGGGQLYALIGSRSKGQSALYRFSINDISINPIDNETVAVVPECFIKNINLKKYSIFLPKIKSY